MYEAGPVLTGLSTSSRGSGQWQSQQNVVLSLRSDTCQLGERSRVRCGLGVHKYPSCL
jgi:hypothetical protein